MEKRHIETISTLINQGKAILFVGEGASAKAKLRRPVTVAGKEITQFVKHRDLAHLLCQELSIADTSKEEASERFEHRRGRVALNQFMLGLFRDLEPEPLHHLIVRQGFKLIYTTNCDALLETAFQQEWGFYPVVVVRNTDVALVRERNTIVKLHGDISQTDTMIITETDYADYPHDRKALFDILRADLYAHSFIFLGYSLRDGSLRALYRSIVSVLGRFVNLSYAIVPPEEFDSEKEGIWRDKFKIQLLSSEIDTFVENLTNTVKQDQHKNQLALRQKRVESAHQRFVSVEANNGDHSILVYLGSNQDLEDLTERFRNEYSNNKGIFAYVDLKATGPFKGQTGLFRYVLETLGQQLKESVREGFGEICDYELDFNEYERKAQSEKYRYLYLHYGERADAMMQGEEAIPHQAQVQEIGEETFVHEAMRDFIVLLTCITEKVGWRRIVLFLDHLNTVEQFLITLQKELLQEVTNNHKNVLFVISYAGSESPKWDGYAFEDRYVQYHEISSLYA